VINVLPSPIDLIRNEIDTLERLRNCSTINNYYGTLSYKANAVYSYYKGITKLNSFLFDAYFKIEIDNVDRKVFVGALITTANKHNEYDQLTYYFAICEDCSHNFLLKKMHFDYAKPRPEPEKRHPIFHLQFPGELSGHLKDIAIKDDHLSPWFSEPRIPFYPMTLALLINLIFKESGSSNSRKVTEDHIWRNLINKNEELVLNPYYEKCYEFIKRKNQGLLSGTNNLLNDLYYGASN
jgi:hypothetical protein